MILENLDNINQKVLNTLRLYVRNNEILNEITLNNYKYSNEEIELFKNSIVEKNKNVQYLLQTISNINNSLQIKDLNNNFIKNISKLELEIKKFWYKFYSKLEKENKKTINYWRIEYLECYKKLFFKNKNLDIDKINSLDLEKQSLTSCYKNSSLKI